MTRINDDISCASSARLSVAELLPAATGGNAGMRIAVMCEHWTLPNMDTGRLHQFWHWNFPKDYKQDFLRISWEVGIKLIPNGGQKWREPCQWPGWRVLGWLWCNLSLQIPCNNNIGHLRASVAFTIFWTASILKIPMSKLRSSTEYYLTWDTKYYNILCWDVKPEDGSDSHQSIWRRGLEWQLPVASPRSPGPQGQCWC